MMKTNKTFHILFAIQFLLIACKIFTDVKVGLFSLIFTVIFATITFVQLSNDKDTDWEPGKNLMLILCSIWLFYYILEIFNPNNVLEAWNINITPYALLPVLCAFLIPIVIRDIKGIELLLFIWSVFIIIASLKGYWQKSHGFSERDRYFLYVLGGWRTHVIWSGIRYFSCFSDASAFGIHSAMATVTFAISAFYSTSKWKKLYFLAIAVVAVYGMGISGTRSAMAIIMGGLLMMILLAKNWKTIIVSSIFVTAIFCFFYFTTIGNGNPFIYKMRSAFRPTKDASYMARVENRERMKTLMINKPLGYGIGLSKAGQFNPKEVMPYPPDSWLISVWVETGIIGLCLYLSIHGILFAWCSWILLFKVRNKHLKGLVTAWLCMSAGFFVAAYAADVLQYPNPMPVYIGFALCFAAPHIDKRLSEKEQKNKIEERNQTLETENNV